MTNAVVETHPDELVTPILGITYVSAMQYCASTGSLSSLRELIKELKDQGALSGRFSDFVSFSDRASEFERRFGRDCMLDLTHRGMESLTANGVITPKQFEAIVERQNVIASNPEHAEQANKLREEGRQLA